LGAGLMTIWTERSDAVVSSVPRRLPGSVVVGLGGAVAVDAKKQ